MSSLPRTTAFAIVFGLLALPSPPAVPQSEVPEMVAPAVRDVTPPGITPGPKVDGPMERIPLPPPPPEPPRWRRFFLPKTTDSATFVTDDVAIRVLGVSPPARDATCPSADGAWPCGRTALHSLRMFLRGRAVECLFPPAGDAVQIIAPCRVGSTDLALWLLDQGWAEPSDLATDAHRAAAEAARCAGRGMWRGTSDREGCPTLPPS